ncbi:MAG: 50S ribosome-binding GTPase [Thermoplasmata archaeon]|nr:50S ribosome-binding GTPase [Thermoplasmata archaeon]
MSSLEEEITRIEDEIRNTSYNKATQLHVGRLRAKVAALRLEREKRAKGSGGGLGYAVRKSGHATVGLVGYPSVGKSTLLTAMTGAASQSAAYDFTTLTIIPGMMHWGGAAIQVLDMPGLVPGAAKGRGRGREVLSVVRSADLVLFMIDAEHTDFKALLAELENAGIRINTRPPKVVVTPAERGGVVVTSTVKITHLAGGLAVEIAREFGMHNGAIVLREDATPEQLIDVLAGNRVYVRALLAVNKADLLEPEGKERLRSHLKPFVASFLSARTGQGVPELIDAIGKALAFIRVYLKPPGREADLIEPIILRKGDRIEDLLRRLPTELGVHFRSAQVSGPSARFSGQTVGRDHRLADTDVVTIVVHHGGVKAA